MLVYPVNKNLGNSPITVHHIVLDKPAVYPSEYWTKQKELPTVTVAKITAEASYQRLTLMINDTSWSDIKVATFMVKVIQENDKIFSFLATEGWQNEGGEIVKAGEKVTPLSLLRILETDETETVPTAATTSTRVERLSRFFALLLIYRKTISKNVTECARRMNNFFQANIGMQESDMAELSGFVGEFMLTPSYKKIICAIDMYFFKYPTLNYASIRMATLPSRYRGCAALTALREVARVTGLSARDLILFVFTKPISKEVANVTRTDQNADDLFGYFPYQLDMGLTTKSAYSMSANPTLYLWLHIIGCVYGYGQSQNARMPDIIRPATVENAVAAALGMRGLSLKLSVAQGVRDNMELAQADSQDLDLDGSDEVDVAAEASTSSVPHSLVVERVTAVLRDLKDNCGFLSQDQLKTLSNRANWMKTCPAGTVGEYFWRHFAQTTTVNK